MFRKFETNNYLCMDYQNRRPDYLSALWQIVDWKVVERRKQ